VGKNNLKMDINFDLQNFYNETNRADEEIDLAKAALAFARTEYPDLDIEEYLNALDTMAEEVRERLIEERYPLKVIKTINSYLFDDLGFEGNTRNYYDPRNSFLNDVIDRRTGIPITLSIIYLEIAKRIDFPMVGIGMPGHFIIRPNFENVGIFVDAFNQGEILFEQDCEERLQQVYQQPVKLEPRFLASISNREILVRMLTNLKMIYLHQREFGKALTIIDAILILVPDNPNELRDRGLLYYELNEWSKAVPDLESYLTVFPNAEDALMIRILLQKIR
jgi:regulator of sirC expression with transglutaminase-like and TPR domain